jgi:hypothetical protein
MKISPKRRNVLIRIVLSMYVLGRLVAPIDTGWTELIRQAKEGATAECMEAPGWMNTTTVPGPTWIAAQYIAAPRLLPPCW